ncbi:MAG: trimethylamine methyltransferase family protein, partial [Pseudorhodobacter sp.]
MTTRRGGRNRSPETESPRSHSYRNLRHPFAPQRVFSDDAIANIHAMALRVLSELGLKILHPEARTILKSAGALVDEATQM